MENGPTLMLEEMRSKSCETRRATEDRLAVIFLVIILAFIFCHLPRVGIDVHEIFTLERSNMCKEARMSVFPAWTYIAVYISHFCLVINATMNMYIYCFMSPLFREEVWKVFLEFKPKSGFCQKKQNDQA